MTQDQKRIVVIEDDPEMLDLIQVILRKNGFEVTTANNGRDGLALIEEVSPNAILLDLMMPDMDGWEVYQNLKSEESSRHIPVIVVTAKAASIDKVLGLHIAKVDAYITKPFNQTDLVQTINRLLQP